MATLARAASVNTAESRRQKASLRVSMILGIAESMVYGMVIYRWYHVYISRQQKLPTFTIFRNHSSLPLCSCSEIFQNRKNRQLQLPGALKIFGKSCLLLLVLLNDPKYVIFITQRILLVLAYCRTFFPQRKKAVYYVIFEYKKILIYKILLNKNIKMKQFIIDIK